MSLLNGKLSRAVALLDRGTASAQEFREALLPAADAILERIGLTVEEFTVLLTSQRWRDRKPSFARIPDPPTPEADLQVAEAAAAVATATLADQVALDTWLVAKAEVQAAHRRGVEPSASALEGARDANELWTGARKRLERAVVKHAAADQARARERALRSTESA